MFVYSFKGQNLKLIASLAVSVLVILAIVLIVPIGNADYTYPEGVLPAVKRVTASDFKNVVTNEDRVAFLKRYGWEVDEQAREIAEIVLPTRFDPVLEQYNELQIGEGLDLNKYKGKSVKRYTYLVRNYEYDGTVYANLILYRDRVIAGDVCSARKDGFVHGLTKENDFLT